MHWCRSWLGHFDTEDVLKTYKMYCRGVDTSGQVPLLPDENPKVKMENEPYACHPINYSNLFIKSHP